MFHHYFSFYDCKGNLKKGIKQIYHNEIGRRPPLVGAFDG